MSEDRDRRLCAVLTRLTGTQVPPTAEVRVRVIAYTDVTPAPAGIHDALPAAAIAVAAHWPGGGALVDFPEPDGFDVLMDEMDKVTGT